MLPFGQAPFFKAGRFPNRSLSKYPQLCMTSNAACLTKSAMTRPLFEPLTEDHERPDEWSAPLGFVIGGMATYAKKSERDGQLAEQYRVAAESSLTPSWKSVWRTTKWPTRRSSSTGITVNCC